MSIERSSACIHEAYERQAALRPHAVAIGGRTGGITYAALDRQANRLAHHLRALGVGPEVTVGLRLAPTAAFVSAALAVLKAGGAYLPLDPRHPAERHAFALADAGARVLVADAGGAPPGAWRLVRVGAGGLDLSHLPATPPAPGRAHPGDLAYVVYTSGSTGLPKGVMVEHRQVTRLLEGTGGLFGFGPGDVWTLFHSTAFDFSVWEMWGALRHGGRLVPVPFEVSRDPGEFCRLLARERVTVLNQTPAAFRQLASARAEADADLTLRVVIFGGEALTAEMLRPWITRWGDARPALVNMYGITETTVHVTQRRMTAGDLDTARGSMIGRPLPHLTVQVLDPDWTEVPAGTTGELYVGGDAVARGYVGRPALTAERFVPDPAAGRPGARMYRSGDAAIRHDGDLQYCGRLDQQVQIRGHRVEPGEVEAVLGRHPAVAEAAVVAEADPGSDLRLVAYWVPAGPDRPGVAALREHLQRFLPEPMVPGALHPVERLPLTDNGKLDRDALAALAPSPPEPDEGFAAPRTALERSLAEIWSAALGVDHVGVDDDFFELGGHSLLATRVVAETRARLGLDASLRLLFDAPTVAGFARTLEPAAAGDPRPAAAEEVRRDERV